MRQEDEKTGPPMYAHLWPSHHYIPYPPLLILPSTTNFPMIRPNLAPFHHFTTLSQTSKPHSSHSRNSAQDLSRRRSSLPLAPSAPTAATSPRRRRLHPEHRSAAAPSEDGPTVFVWHRDGVTCGAQWYIYIYIEAFQYEDM